MKPNETPGMDASVVKLQFQENMYMISTTDFFYPLVDDPYIQGKIACANVLSDLYAMAVTQVDTMLMILGVSREMNSTEQDIVTTDLIRGFNDLAKEAGTNVTGGQTVMNPWPIVGGVATSVRHENQFIRPENAIPGDVLILTKPLGTQVAVNLYEWLKKTEKWNRIQDIVSREQAKDTFRKATESMCRLNRTAAELMHKYQAHSATDVTGFGILGHLQNQVESQKASVDFELETLPILQHMVQINTACNNMFKLLDGYSSETSGGLLLCLPAKNASAFIEELEEIDGQPAWIVGRVVSGTRQARIVDQFSVIEV